ncbi:glycosyl hydrolase family 18 protein [Actinosynnema sp. NPDC050436]|uniref:glycosyl hydrolase family 18 protein n=1 Tax=Actinosynnema sp. NPDC050436 TaxID=3155659 RepID=UPI0033C1F4C7
MTNAKHTTLYYQTHFVKDGKAEHLVSPLALVTNDAGVTDLNLGAVHLNDLDSDKEKHTPLTINDTVPEADQFKPMWEEVEQIQANRSAQRMKVHAFVGGAAEGTFTRLEKDFGRYYPLLRDFLAKYHFDGVDLDIETEGRKMKDPTQAVGKVIDQLWQDFGPGFPISLAPGATELIEDKGGLSYVKYRDLYRSHGSKIARFHAQFYCGWGSMSTKDDYLGVVRDSGIPADKIVAGVVTQRDHCEGAGYVGLADLKKVIAAVEQECPGFGGVFGWEYHRSGESDGTQYRDKPWLWAKEVSTALRGD